VESMMTSHAKLTFLGAVLLLGACSGQQDRITQGEGTAPRALRIATAAMAGGLPQAALNATQNVLDRDPGNVEALIQQADALTALGRDDAAAEAYRRVLAKDASPNRAQARLARLGAGRADLAAGRAAEAEAIYAALAASAPEDAVGYNGLAIAYDQQGRHEEAQAAYRKALALADTSATRSNLGLSLAMSGDAAGALELLRPLAETTASSPRIRHNLAFALELAGDRQGARRVLATDMPREQVTAALSGFDAFRISAAPAGKP